MEKHTMSILDYVAFISVLTGSTLIGLYHAWKSKNIKTEESKQKYMTGGKNLHVLPVAMSLVASFMSIGSVLGLPAEIYAHSVAFSMSFIGGIIGIIICRTIFLPMFYDLQLPSVNKYLQMRFKFPILRIFTSLSFVLMNMFSSGIAIYGPALAISSVTPLPVNTAIMAVGFVCTVYTGLGGMKAVIWTDVLQFSVMIIGLVMVAVQGTITAGGWDQVWEIAGRGNLLQWANFRIDPEYGVPTFLECVLGMVVGYGGMFSTNQMSVQRFCSFPTKKKAITSVYVSIIFMLAFVSLSCYCGVAIFANYYGCDPLLKKEIFSPDQLLPYYVMRNLSYIPGVAGIFVAAVFCGSLSTISSFINSVTVVLWHDIMKRFVKVSIQTENIILKVIALTFGVTTTFLAFLLKGLGTVMEVALVFFGCVFGPQFGMFLLGATCPFVDGASATFGFVTGQVFVMSLNIAVMALGRPARRIPTSLDACPFNQTVTGSHMMNETHDMMYVTYAMMNESYAVPTETTLLKPEVYWVHNISPFFMPFLGAMTTIVCGLFATLFTGGMKRSELDVRYVCPLVRTILSRTENNMPENAQVALMEKPFDFKKELKEIEAASC